VQIHNAELGEKDGRRAQISSVERKLLYEIHPWIGTILMRRMIKKLKDYLL
jgi:hypothetical protein